MKTCTKCHQEKELTEFHKRLEIKDGLRSHCKSCQMIYQKNYRKTAKGKVAHRRGNKNYYKTEKGKVVIKRYRQSEKGKVSQKRFRTNHSNYIKAVRAVNHAIRAGKLPRPDTFQCHYCPAQAEQYHHHKGYEPENWLKVQSVCKKCHRRVA